MEILKLEIKNFLTISEANLELNAKGLVLLRGENIDNTSAISNGAGKSSIPDAIYWALYGETAREESGDMVINNKAKKDCHVKLTLKDGDVLYTIKRHRKDKEHKNATLVRSMEDKPGASWAILEKGTEKETQDVINGIMGCSKEVFSASIYAGQEQMPDLPKMTDKQLKTLIEEASGTERLEKAYVVASRKTLLAKNELETTANQKAASVTRLTDIDLRIRTAAFNFKEFEDSRVGKAKAFELEIDELNAKKVAVHAEIDALPKADVIQKGLDTIADKLKGFAEFDRKRSEHERVVKIANHEVSVAQADVNNKQIAIDKCEHGINNAEEAMSKPCESCGKPHTADEIDEWKHHQGKLLDNYNAFLEEAKDKLAHAEMGLRAAQTVLDDFVKTIPDVSALMTKQAQLNKALSVIEVKKRSLVAFDNAIQIAKNNINAVKTGDNPHKSLLTLLADDKKKEIANIAAHSTKLDALQKNLAIAEAVQKVFSPAGVRAHILDTVTPFLNDRTAEYLNALSDGATSAVWSTLAETTKGETREKFNIEVTDTMGAQSFKGLSGGEKRKVRIATMLALQDLVAARATKPINLWIGDEVDDALDPAGLERLMGIMENKARERGTVLVISHNDLTDWIDQVATVRKEGGASTVTGVLSV